MVNYVYYLVCLCFGIFGLKYFSTVIEVSCSFLFVLRVCERLTTHSLISFYCFEFLSLLEKLFVLFFSDWSSAFAHVCFFISKTNPRSDWLQYRWRIGFICQSSDECDLIYFSVSEEFFLGISVQELFKGALSPPLVFLIGKEKSQRVPILVSEWFGFAVCTICFAF